MAVQNIPNGRRPAKPPERSQTPLWFVAVGLGVVLFSHGMKDQMAADVVFWFGVVFAAIAMIYWAFQPRHGM
jgi:hypothetical protein